MARCLALLIVCLVVSNVATAAPAMYSIAWTIKQDASFLKQECEAMTPEEILKKGNGSPFDDCACKGRILYPQLSGLADAAKQAAINASLLSRIEPDSCPETKPYAAPEGRSGDRHVTRFDVSFANEHFLSVLFWHDSYSAGAAHNSWTVEGASFDLATGKALDIADLIAPDKLGEVNARIAESLDGAYPGHNMPVMPVRNGESGKAAGTVPVEKPSSETPAEAGSLSKPGMPAAPAENPFDSLAPQAHNGTIPPNRKVIETYTATPEKAQKKTETYISLDGCSGCTYHLTPEGLEIVFQLSEVATFGEGNPRITIGKEYLKKDISERL